MQQCLEYLDPILQDYAPDNAQFPLYMFSDFNCQGVRYPPEGEFNLWYQYLGEPRTVSTPQGDVQVVQVTPATLGMTEIKSVYVPPQSVLEMWAPNDEGYFSVVGPQIITDTQAYLSAWRNFDDSPCGSDELAYCGNRVNWSVGDGQPIYRMRITSAVPWTNLLARLASDQQPLALNGKAYPVDNDALYADICPGNGEDFNCECQNAYDEILLNHPGAANQTYVNVLPNGCDPTTQFAPSQALVGTGTSYECQNQINAQLQSGTFPTLSQGGPQQYVCAGLIYLNAYDDGSTDVLARFDDFEDDRLEAQEMHSSTPAYAYWLAGAFGVLALLLVLVGSIHQGDMKAKERLRQRIKASRLYPSTMRKHNI